MLMDLRTLDWDDELLEILSIPRQMLPEIRPSSDPRLLRHDAGRGARWRRGARLRRPGRPAGGALRPDLLLRPARPRTPMARAASCCSTPAPSRCPPERSADHGRLWPARTGTTYALEGSIAITGAAVQWLRDNLGLIQNAAETEEIAQSVEDAGGIYFVPAFSGLFAPYWDMDARGVIVGLTRYVTRAHLVRATLEAICYQTREVLEAMRADSGIALTALKVDGGATVNNFLMQLQADILGVPVVRPVVHETTALGAAYAAGLATGLWSGLDDLRANWGVDRVFEPQWSEDRREEVYAGWKKAVERSRGWVTG